MKNKLLLIIFAYNVIAYCTIDQTLDTIRVVESNNNSNLLYHADGVSFGLYGLTQLAIDEVARIYGIKIVRVSKLKSLNFERKYAKKYLELMYKRYNCKDYIEASGYYHSKEINKRTNYINKIRSKYDGKIL